MFHSLSSDVRHCKLFQNAMVRHYFENLSSEPTTTAYHPVVRLPHHYRTSLMSFRSLSSSAFSQGPRIAKC